VYEFYQAEWVTCPRDPMGPHDPCTQVYVYLTTRYLLSNSHRLSSLYSI